MKLDDIDRKEILRSLGWATLLCIFLTGLPIFLILGVGWPSPKSLPQLSELSLTLHTGAIPADFVVKSIALMLWIVWLQMAFSTGIDIWAHLHGRATPQVVLIPRFMRYLSSRVIAGALLASFALQNPATAVADNRDLLIPITPVTVSSNEESSQSSDSNNDNLQDVAEKYLGNPDRWTEVFVLNKDQIQNDNEPQHDSQPLHDPTSVKPGWELIMPTTTQKSNDSQQATQYMVAKGDSLWKIADQELGDPERWVEVFDANRQTIQDPNMILPGWELLLPPPPATNSPFESKAFAPAISENTNSLSPELITKTPPLLTTIAFTPKKAEPALAYATATPTVVLNVPDQPLNQSALDRQTLLALGGLGVFASSFIWMLTKLRQAKPRRLPANRRPTLTEAPLNNTEKRLWTCIDNDKADFLDASLRFLTTRLENKPTPAIMAVNLRPTGISLMLETPIHPPKDFAASEDLLTWELPKQTYLNNHLHEALQAPALLPLLIALGNIGKDEFLLNLAHIRVLNLQGDQNGITEYCTSAAAQLASSHLVDDLAIICVGFEQKLVAFERVHYAKDLTTALALIHQQQCEAEALLGTSTSSSKLQPSKHSDISPTTVVIAPNPLNPEDAAALLKKCNVWTCLIAQGIPNTNWNLRFIGEAISLQPLDIWLNPSGISSESASAIEALLTTSIAAKQQPTEMLPNANPSHNNPVAPILKQTQTQRKLEVRMLGPVEVSGTQETITSNRVLDIIAYLAAHPEGVDQGQLMTNLWPADNPPSRSTLSNSLSRARQALGINSQGHPYLPRMDTNGVYRLHPEVRTDLQLFRELQITSHKHPGNEGRQILAKALELVRGTPFTGGNGKRYRWAEFGLRSEIELAIDNTAHELAHRCIQAGNPDSARAAVMISLRTVGLCEECYRWRLKAAANNHAEVRRMAELTTSLTQRNHKTFTPNEPHADTQAIYDQIMSGKILFE
ncbi:MAG: LysM peptidoglycan-binding domain-containing protein [Acidimicrobiia bacterium]|nr:LysM peptidoglycan-binding domain-containing protein [Acidimicrobiia bacterium]MYC57548.1 LysM peptidoglycan-binding domain-containing protein [Acidimicrobiia bacterium]MYI30088.1 LysM peptidoglycan-binding domain-containing protein [Acidimicrobiia bacterium]